jgi:hypothetical protein
MDNLGYVKGTLFAGLLITVNQGWAANATAPVKVSNYVIPSVFANALYQGMSVPFLFVMKAIIVPNAASKKSLMPSLPSRIMSFA